MQVKNQAVILRLISKAILGAVLILALQIDRVEAQSGSSAPDGTARSYPAISQETYNRVLDILFPRNDSDSSKTVFTFVLRFKPYSQPESQIVIKRGAEKVEVVEYTSLDGDIYSKLNEILGRTSKEDAVEMAKAIKVKRRVVSVPYLQLRRWYANFFDSLTSTTKKLREKGEEFDKTGGSETVFLHGAIYDLWYKQFLNQMSFSLYDVDVNDARHSSEFKLVQWMDSVRRDVEKLK